MVVNLNGGFMEYGLVNWVKEILIWFKLYFLIYIFNCYDVKIIYFFLIKRGNLSFYNDIFDIYILEIKRSLYIILIKGIGY